MDATPATPPQPDKPDPKQDRPALSMPEGIRALFNLAVTLLLYGQRLRLIIVREAEHPHFATLAAVAGTYDLDLINRRIMRGMLRLQALVAYLTKRAEKGRDLAFVEPGPRPVRANVPAEKPEPTEPRGRRAPYDPDSPDFNLIHNYAKEVRTAPIGRTIARSCLDLAIIPGFCTSEIWTAILQTLEYYGSSLNTLYQRRTKREKTFQRQREKRPETWHWNWQDLRPPTVRQVLGRLIGEPQAARPPPEPQPTPA